VFSTIGGSHNGVPEYTNDVIRHGSSGALFVRLHLLGGPIGEPVAAF